MDKRSSNRGKPRDVNALAKSVVDEAAGREKELRKEFSSDLELTPEERSRIAAVLGRLGGLKGGKARAERLTAERRSEIARNAAVKRWHAPEIEK